MKKALFILAALSCGLANAQTAPNKNEAIVQKVTATWCGPCGAWGWDLMEEIISDNSASCMVLSMYSSTSSDLYNSAAGDLGAWGQSYPNWGVNNINRTVFDQSGAIFDQTTRVHVKAAVDSFATTSPVASTGFFVNIAGGTMTVTTNTKFWQNASGDYYVAAYIIEDSVEAMQNSDVGMVLKTHHNVLRGSMTDTSTYGQLLVSGGVSANTEFPRTFTVPVNSSWNPDHLSALVVVWKKNGTNYDFVNANHTKEVGTSVGTIEAVNDLRLYPNPATTTINATGTLTGSSGAVISVANALGQVIYTSNISSPVNGKFTHAIKLDNVSNGLYQVRIMSDGHTSSQKVLISK